jgi:hypothetical protein
MRPHVYLCAAFTLVILMASLVDAAPEPLLPPLSCSIPAKEGGHQRLLLVNSG